MTVNFELNNSRLCSTHLTSFLELVLKTAAFKKGVTRLPKNFENIEHFVGNLKTLIRGLLSYIDQVIVSNRFVSLTYLNSNQEKKIPGNPAIGRYIMDIILCNSTFDTDLCNGQFNNSLHVRIQRRN